MTKLVLGPLTSKTRVAGYSGLLWLAFATLGAAVFFDNGIETLLLAWQQPEYSHGPLIPVLSGVLFLRQLKGEPIHSGPVNRIPGLVLMVLSLVLGLFGKLADIGDVTAYGLILWVGAILLLCFGWDQGKRFWPPVVHLVFMLPLPGVLYYKVSTQLQFISSEMGVWFLQLLRVPVFLEGNVIDLGVLKLHVAEACSGLRYLFPILSFSYIFAVLFRGPMTHKAILLLAAVPITVLMNSVRIALAGLIVNHVGVDHVEGFSHFFEGWVIFVLCVLLLFAIARGLLMLQPGRPSLVQAMDLEFSGLVEQSRRIRLVEPSGALMATALITALAAAAWQTAPEAQRITPSRDSFSSFPSTLGQWSMADQYRLSPDVDQILNASDYVAASFTRDGANVDVFAAWFADQTRSGAHSPEICLPGSGWEFASLDRVDISEKLGSADPFPVNRIVIQFGEKKMIGFYWFQQNGRRVAWDFGSKLYLLWDGVLSRRKDGGIVRLLTEIDVKETELEAEQRLLDILGSLDAEITEFIPD